MGRKKASSRRRRTRVQNLIHTFSFVITNDKITAVKASTLGLLQARPLRIRLVELTYLHQGTDSWQLDLTANGVSSNSVARSRVLISSPISRRYYLRIPASTDFTIVTPTWEALEIASKRLSSTASELFVNLAVHVEYKNVNIAGYASPMPRETI